MSAPDEYARALDDVARGVVPGPIARACLHAPDVLAASLRTWAADVPGRLELAAALRLIAFDLESL